MLMYLTCSKPAVQAASRHCWLCCWFWFQPAASMSRFWSVESHRQRIC